MNRAPRSPAVAVVALGVLAASASLPAAAANRPYSRAYTLLEVDQPDAWSLPLSIDGDTLAVGSAQNAPAGAVHIFARHRRNGRRWQLVRRIESPRPEDAFGENVALDGDTLAVATRWSNRVRVFSRHLGGRNAWGLVRELEAGLGGLDLEGDLLVVGNDRRTGSVALHQRHLGGPDQWGLLRRFAGTGLSLDLSGDRLIVSGVRGGCGGLADYCTDGYFVYERRAGFERRWPRVLAVPPDDELGRGTFGAVVALEGDTAVSSDGIRKRRRGGWRRVSPALNDSHTRERDAYAVRGNVIAASTWVTDPSTLTGEWSLRVFERLDRADWRVVLETTPGCNAVAIGRSVVACATGGAVRLYHRRALFADDFEGDGLSSWNRRRGRVDLARPGLRNSRRALRVELDGTAGRSFVETRLPPGEPMVSLAFSLLTERVQLDGGRVVIAGLFASGRRLVELILQEGSDGHEVALWVWRRGRGLQPLGAAPIPAGEVVDLRVEWQRAPTETVARGKARLLVNGREAVSARNLATDGLVIKGLRLGLPSGSQGTRGGEVVFDRVRIER